MEQLLQWLNFSSISDFFLFLFWILNNIFGIVLLKEENRELIQILIYDKSSS